MDIDKLFKVIDHRFPPCITTLNAFKQVPKLPAGIKRKLPDTPTPEILKKMRPDDDVEMKSDASSHTETPALSRSVRVEDDPDDDHDTSFAPGGDADYFVEEDEEGRFYGGGLTSQQKEILSIFERAEGEGDQDEVCVSSSQFDRPEQDFIARGSHIA